MLQKSKLTHRNSNATNCDESLSPDLITCTDIIFITVHMNTGSYLRWLLIQCEQNIACFMVESFETKRTNQNNFFGVLICVYQIYQLFVFVVDILFLYCFKLFFVWFLHYFAIISFWKLRTLDWMYRLLNLILNECSWRLTILQWRNTIRSTYNCTFKSRQD